MLACTFKEAIMFQDLLSSANKFKKATADILKSSTVPSVSTLESQIDWGTRLAVDLPEIADLNEMLSMAKWISDYEKTIARNRCTTLLELRKLKATGAGLKPHPSFQSSLAKVMNMLAVSENLEQRAVSCLAPGYRSKLITLENIVNESESLGVALPRLLEIKTLIKTAKDWNQKAAEILSNEERVLTPEEVELIQLQGEKIPVELELLDSLQQKLFSINVWKDQLNQKFTEQSDYTLLKELGQEIEAGENTLKANQVSGQEICGNVPPKNPVVERLTKFQKQKLGDIRKKFETDDCHLVEQAKNCRACTNCGNDGLDHIQHCLPCGGKYFSCRSRILGFHGSQRSFVCPSCREIKRVTVEQVQQLASSYRQLGFVFTEGKVVDYIAREMTRWQKSARLTLSTGEITSALKLLNYQCNNPLVWSKECFGEKSTNEQRLKVVEKQLKTCDDVIDRDWLTESPIDLSLSSSRKELLYIPTVEELAQKIASDGSIRQQLLEMDLSEAAQAYLNDLLLETRVLNIATEEAQIIGFLLFAAWQRHLIVEEIKKEAELRRKREEEEELKRKLEEELRKKREEELRRKREEELRRKREEEELQRKREEELLKKKKEEEIRKKLQEEELRRKKEEEELQKKKEEEMQKIKEQEELRKKQEEEMQKKQEEEELLKRKNVELRRKKEEEERQRKEDALRRKREEEIRKRKEEDEKKWKMDSKEPSAVQTKKGALPRKRFQELQRVTEEEHKKQKLSEPKKNHDDLSKKSRDKEEWMDTDDKNNLGKNQENEKKDKPEDNLEKDLKAKKRKTDVKQQDNDVKKPKKKKVPTATLR